MTGARLASRSAAAPAPAHRTIGVGAWEKAFAIFSLFIMSEGWSRLAVSDIARTDSDPRKLLINLTVGVIALGLGLYRRSFRSHVFLAVPMVSALLLFAMASVLWSFDPLLTARRVSALVLSTLALIYLARTYTAEQMLIMIRWAFLGGVTLAILLCVGAPSIGVQQEQINHGAWFGGYFDKIASGYAGALAIALTLVMPKRLTGGLFWRAVWIGAGLLLVIMSQSRTGWIAACLGVLVILVSMLLRNRRLAIGLKAAIGAALVGVGALAASAYYVFLLPLMGRTESFSGRAALWRGAQEATEGGRIVTGYGYRSFWDNNDANQTVRSYIEYWGTGSMPRSGHNGYLDAYVELGLVGVGLTIAILATTLARLWIRTSQATHDWTWSAWMMLVAMFAFENLSYGFSLRHSSLYWGTCLLAALYSAASHREARHG